MPLLKLFAAMLVGFVATADVSYMLWPDAVPWWTFGLVGANLIVAVIVAIELIVQVAQDVEPRP